MTIDEFEIILREAVAHHLPEASFRVRKQRSIILRGTISINDETFIQVYFNALTEKTSYALIYKRERVMGYDNYRFWHCHPMGESQKHIPCEEPTIVEAIAKIAEADKQLPC
ncbi:MAG: hypothetical protein ABIG63_09145 [Chloroflexota bacterium]